LVPAKYLVTPSISNMRPFVFAKPVAVGPVVVDVLVDEVALVVDEVLVLTDDVELVLTEDVVEVVLTVDEVLDVVAAAEVAVPGTHW
jgi:hypothetical protein